MEKNRERNNARGRALGTAPGCRGQGALTQAGWTLRGRGEGADHTSGPVRGRLPKANPHPLPSAYPVLGPRLSAGAPEAERRPRPRQPKERQGELPAAPALPSNTTGCQFRTSGLVPLSFPTNTRPRDPRAGPAPPRPSPPPAPTRLSRASWASQGSGFKLFSTHPPSSLSSRNRGLEPPAGPGREGAGGGRAPGPGPGGRRGRRGLQSKQAHPTGEPGDPVTLDGGGQRAPAENGSAPEGPAAAAHPGVPASRLTSSLGPQEHAGPAQTSSPRPGAGLQTHRPRPRFPPAQTAKPREGDGGKGAESSPTRPPGLGRRERRAIHPPRVRPLASMCSAFSSRLRLPDAVQRVLAGKYPKQQTLSTYYVSI
ncbi:uncharacterized protein [Notamacropus eugenii]|uniref:uncharacterized protein n=1 Tax=Notamacropus eugenii TaxID=9315 RepID=UPI003B685959